MIRKITNVAMVVLLTGLLFACGGGDGAVTPAPQIPPTVAAVTASQVVYKKDATITVTGQNLDSGITMTALGCATITEQTGGTATSRSYSCIPVVGTSLYVTVSAQASKALLMNVSVPVPLPQVSFVTSLGTFVVELRPDRAKGSVDNFLQYVDSGFYSDTIFHRIIASGGIVQGGGYAVGQTTLKATNAPIVLETTGETGLSNLQGTIAMARSSALNSATSQFFINTINNNAAYDSSSAGYAVFGSVIQGMNVVKALQAVAVDSAGKPDTPVILNSVTRIASPLTVTTPLAPTGVVATGGNHQLTLTWDTSDSSVALYTVYTSTSPSVTPANGTKHVNLFPPAVITSLTAGTTYYSVITAVNRAGESVPSAEVSAATLP